MHTLCLFQQDVNVRLQTGDAFAAAADIYVRRFLQKGIPSLYTDLKSLYSNPAKAEVGSLSVQPAVLSDLHLFSSSSIRRSATTGYTHTTHVVKTQKWPSTWQPSCRRSEHSSSGCLTQWQQTAPSRHGLASRTQSPPRTRRCSGQWPGLRSTTTAWATQVLQAGGLTHQ
jgi:NMDA receptor-regulated protein 1